MNNKVRAVAAALAVLVALVLMVGVLVSGRARGASIPVPTPTPSSHVGNPPGKPDTSMLVPTPIRIDDLATQTPTPYKVTVVVQHSDGTVEWYLVASDQTSSFIRQLPPTDQVLAIEPPQVLMGHYAIITPTPGTVTFPSSQPSQVPPATPTPG